MLYLAAAELLSFATPKGKQLWDDVSLAYTETQGHPKLRDEIAALYKEVTPHLCSPSV